MIIANKTILIALGIIVVAYFLYKLLFVKNDFEKEYEKVYNKILNSEEYKVKGQYDK